MRGKLDLRYPYDSFGRISGNLDAKNYKTVAKNRRLSLYIGRCRVRIKEDQKAIWW